MAKFLPGQGEQRALYLAAGRNARCFESACWSVLRNGIMDETVKMIPLKRMGMKGLFQ